MPEHDGLMRVFWPSDITSSDLTGVLVGWRNSDLDVVVVAVLDHVDVSQRLRFRPAIALKSHSLYEHLFVIDLSVAKECRKCAQNGHFTSECPPLHCEVIRTLWPGIDACSRLAESRIWCCGRLSMG